VNDQHGSPTLTIDLAKASIELVGNMNGEKYPFGIYHLTNSGACTWYEYALEIFTHKNVDISVTPVTSDEFPRPAPRPKYSILNNNKGPKLRSWQEAIADYLGNYYQSN